MKETESKETERKVRKGHRGIEFVVTLCIKQQDRFLQREGDSEP